MAPYVIVTNGIQSYFYETVTGKEVEKEYIINKGFELAIDSEISLRFQALKNFIGYSYNNLVNFCNVFNKECLERFSANENEKLDEQLQKIYIPSLFIKRNKVIKTFEELLNQNNKCVFAIFRWYKGAGKANAIWGMVGFGFVTSSLIRSLFDSPLIGIHPAYVLIFVILLVAFTIYFVVTIDGENNEVENLSPVRQLAPGEKLEHTESWMIAKLPAELGDTDENLIDRYLLPEVHSFLKEKL